MPRDALTSHHDPAPRPGPGFRRSVTLLREHPRFRLLWFSNLFFFGGVWTQTLVMGWSVYEETGSELLVAVFTAARLAPMLLGPLAGVFADRHDRVRLLLVACAWAVAASSVVAVLTSTDAASYRVLLVAGLAIGLAQSPSQPARSALVLALVGRANLSSANAVNAVAVNATQVVGPALGGVMISTVGAAAALWISTAWYVVSLFLLLPLRGAGHRPAPHTTSVVAMVRSGFRTVRRNRLASTTLLITLAANVFVWPVYQAFMPVFARGPLGLDADGLGWLLTCAGGGGLVGALLIGALGDFRRKGGVFLLGTAAWGALWAAFAITHDVPRAFVLMAGIGLLGSLFSVLQTTLLLLTTDADLHGRALGLQELVIGVMPLTALLLGIVADRFGVGPTTFVSALLLVVTLLGLALWSPSFLRYSGTSAPATDTGPASSRPDRRAA